MCLQIIYLISMYQEDLTLNNRQMLICHKIPQNPTKPIGTFKIWRYFADGNIWFAVKNLKGQNLK